MKLFSTIFTRFSGCNGLLVILAAIFCAGCASMDKPVSASFASVVIVGRTVAQIQQATLTVFQQNGYQTVSQSDGAMVFEREATRREQLDYAGIVGAQEGTKVIIRVRTTIEAKDTVSYWLSCKVWAVSNPGQTIFESTTALFGFQSRPYQKLMDQVKTALQRPPATP